MELANKIASYIDIYINDAFGASHRAHATIVALPQIIKKKGLGFLMKKEIEMLDKVLIEPAKPFCALLGGSKVSDKIGMIEHLLEKIPIDSTSVYHLLPARYDGRVFGKTRDDFIKEMAFHHKVKAIVQYYPLYRYEMFKRAGFGEANCPNTDSFYDNMVSFPFQDGLSDEQFDYMIQSTRKTLQKLRTKTTVSLELKNELG